MIGKPEWFTRRKYMGWGLMPKTWQGWVYLLGFVAVLLLIQFLPISGDAKIVSMLVIALIIAIDVIDMMLRMKQDERETRHEAVAERNAMWIMLIVLTTGIAYEAGSSIVKGGLVVDPVIIIALLAALATKAITNAYLDRKD